VATPYNPKKRGVDAYLFLKAEFSVSHTCPWKDRCIDEEGVSINTRS